MDIIYYDLRKAFDKVFCGMLVAKVGWYEPDEWVTNWVKKSQLYHFAESPWVKV